jgi:hypothetical protein
MTFSYPQVGYPGNGAADEKEEAVNPLSDDLEPAV